jgi:hypothetical protein
MRGLYVLACALVAALACGESRRPIGEECLRDEDCLSSFCAARACVSAPTLVTGGSHPPDDEEPLIPTSDEAGSIRDAGGDAPSDS